MMCFDKLIVAARYRSSTRCCTNATEATACDAPVHGNVLLVCRGTRSLKDGPEDYQRSRPDTGTLGRMDTMVPAQG